MKLMHVVGARPNFMKVAPVYRAISHYRQIKQILVHTGQHYDLNMSDIFFQQLELPAPDINLEVGSDSHAAQTAQIMMRFEEVVLKETPELVLVYGDVNSTVAAALVCAKMGVKVGHVEAGLRSFDRTMPEEINRLLTDQMADFLFTPSQDGDINLQREGVSREKIHFVGNVMIDTLIRLLPIALKQWQKGHLTLEGLTVDQGCYVLVTLHRPSNVDEPVMLAEIMAALAKISRVVPVIFPIHPRTRQRLNDLNFLNTKSADQDMRFLNPIGYLDFLALQRHAALVITDSGGIQEETTYLNVPCLTVRENTERPVTVSLGTNVLVGRNMERLLTETQRILRGESRQGQSPPLWDGHAAERIAKIIVMRKA
jgi:UDP-N-acetylglucosamine 2-epimerase (non-hydrolysing)